MKAISDKRLAKLKAEGVEFPTSTFARKPKKSASKKRTNTDPDPATVALVLERDGYQCVVCGDMLGETRGLDYSIHHRKLKAQGVDNRPSNLASICGHGSAGCHSNVHGAPRKAMAAGWIVSGQGDPAKTVMAHSLYGYVLLLDDGSVAEAAAG